MQWMEFKVASGIFPKDGGWRFNIAKNPKKFLQNRSDRFLAKTQESLTDRNLGNHYFGSQNFWNYPKKCTGKIITLFLQIGKLCVPVQCRKYPMSNGLETIYIDFSGFYMVNIITVF